VDVIALFRDSIETYDPDGMGKGKGKTSSRDNDDGLIVWENRQD